MYYRLKQQDKDGKSSYFNIVKLTPKDDNAFWLTAVPNPVAGKVVIKLGVFRQREPCFPSPVYQAGGYNKWT